jgi:hypothetical protein
MDPWYSLVMNRISRLFILYCKVPQVTLLENLVVLAKDNRRYICSWVFSIKVFQGKISYACVSSMLLVFVLYV